MTGSQKWAAYLKTKEVKRLMIELKKKWISNGHLTGKITLNNISDEEKRDIIKDARQEITETRNIQIIKAGK